MDKLELDFGLPYHDMKNYINATITLILLTTLYSFGQSSEWFATGAGNAGQNISSWGPITYSVVSDGTNIYAVGKSNGTQTTLSDTVVDIVDYRFLISYDINGNFRWIRDLEGTGIFDLALDSENHIWITGANYIRKYDSAGDLIFEKDILGTATFLKTSAISIDGDNSVLVCGQFTSGDTVEFEGIQIDGLNQGTHGFVIKYSSNGLINWVQTTNGGFFSMYKDLEVDSNNDIIAIGDFSTHINSETFLDSVIVGSTSIQSYTPLIGFTGRDVFITKFSNSGNFLWVKSIQGVAAGSVFEDFGNKISLDLNNEVYSIGTVSKKFVVGDTLFEGGFNYDILITKFSTEGNLIWKYGFGGNSNGNTGFDVQAGRSISVDNEENIFVSGSFVGQVSVGADLLGNSIVLQNSNFTQSGFVAKFTKDAKLIWAENIKSYHSTINDVFSFGDKVFAVGNSTPDGTYFGIAIPSIPSSVGTNFFVASLIDNSNCTFSNLSVSIELSPSCNAQGKTGVASASINGNTADFSFNWWIGNTTVDEPKFVGATFDGLSPGEYTVIATQKSTLCISSPLTITIIEDCITGFSSQFLHRNNILLKITPNPSSGDVTINFNKHTKSLSNLKIFESHGKLIFAQESIENEYLLLERDKMKAGLYIVVVQINDKYYSSKFLIK